MLPIVQIGPLALQTPGLMYLLGLWLGLALAEKFAPRRGMKPETLYNLVLTSLIAGILGARLGYVVLYPEAFLAAPLSLFSLNPGLLDPFSGFAVAFIAALVYGARQRLPFWNTLDALTPLFAVFLIGAALANAASGAAFGVETGLPWGIELWGAKRHPTQFYELGGAVAILLWLGRLSKRDDLPAGQLFLTFLALTAGARLFFEAFRGDSTLLPGGIRVAQVIAWLILAAALWGLQRRGKVNRLIS